MYRKTKKINIRRLVLITLSILMLFTLGFRFAYASSRYDDLKKKFDSKRSISGLKSDIEIVPASETPAIEEKEFDQLNDDLKELEKLAKEWNVSLKNEKPTGFYTVDEEILKEVQKVYDDDRKVQGLINDKMSLDLLIALTLYRNPMILSAKEKIKAAIERFSQVYNLDLIMQDYVSFTESLSTKVGPQRNKRMISMKFPYPGMLTLKGEIINKDVEIARLDHEDVQINMITMLKSAYYGLEFTIKKEEITEKTLELLDDLEQVANIKYETGRTSFNDVIKVQIKLEKLKDDLKTISEKKTNIKAKIATIINMPPDTNLLYPAENGALFTKSLDELYTLGRENNRGLAILRAKLKRMALMIDMAEKKFYPDFTAGYSYFDDNKVAKVGTQAMMSPFMTKPMISQEKSGWYAKNDAYIREVKEKYKAMAAMLRAKEDDLTFSIKDTHFHIDKASREVDLYETNLIPKSKEALEVAKVGYETGRVSFLDALDADTMWLKFNIEQHKALMHLKVSIAKMESLIGLSISSQSD